MVLINACIVYTQTYMYTTLKIFSIPFQILLYPIPSMLSHVKTNILPFSYLLLYLSIVLLLSIIKNKNKIQTQFLLNSQF